MLTSPHLTTTRSSVPHGLAILPPRASYGKDRFCHALRWPCFSAHRWPRLDFRGGGVVGHGGRLDPPAVHPRRHDGVVGGVLPAGPLVAGPRGGVGRPARPGAASG